MLIDSFKAPKYDNEIHLWGILYSCFDVISQASATAKKSICDAIFLWILISIYVFLFNIIFISSVMHVVCIPEISNHEWKPVMARKLEQLTKKEVKNIHEKLATAPNHYHITWYTYLVVRCTQTQLKHTTHNIT